MKNTKKVDHRCVWRYYHGIFLPSVTYSLPVNSIEAKYLDKLQNRTTRIFLPKLGYNRNTPKASGIPSEQVGIDFRIRIFLHEQRLAKVGTMVKHWRSLETEAKKHLANCSIVGSIYSRNRNTNSQRHKNKVIVPRHNVVSRSSRFSCRN